MRRTIIFSLCFFSVFFTFSLADETADADLQKTFGELEGDAAAMRDYCFEINSVKLADLKDYKKAEDYPERDLCFYKCFYEQIGFINEGKISVESLSLLPDVQGYSEEKMEELGKCIGELDEIKTCADLRNAEACFM